jgi:hypothetical protein
VNSATRRTPSVPVGSAGPAASAYPCQGERRAMRRRRCARTPPAELSMRAVDVRPERVETRQLGRAARAVALEFPRFVPCATLAVASACRML